MRSKERRQGIYLVVVLFLFSLGASAATLQAHLDRTRIAEGDSVLLTLSVEGDSNGAPDLRPLNKDFEVLNQGQSSRVQIVNGHARSWREWRVMLAPRHTGKVQIPALHMGKDVSQPLVLEVLPAAQAAKAGAPRPVLLEAQAAPHDPYVQGKVVYTVRLLSLVPLQQANLSDPNAGDALLERLGQDRQYQTYRDGQSYQVVERRYAIFPQHSGKLTIEPPVLSAEVPEGNRQQRGNRPRDRFSNGADPFGSFDRFFGGDPFAGIGGFGRTRPVRLRARPVTLQVKPQPASAAGPWLPAESVKLNQTWSPDPPVFRVGEPVTRVLAITAQGVSASQLPDLDQGTVAGIKTYPDKPHQDTRADGDTLLAQKVLKTALVPAKAGDFTLPPVTLHWWNVQTDKPELASLPAQTIHVLPGTAPATQPAAPATPASSGASNVAQSAAAPSAQADHSLSAAPEPAAWRSLWRSARIDGYWPWLTLLFALAWLATTVLWLRARRGRPAGGAALTPRPVQSLNPEQALRRIEQACRDGDARALRQALLVWAAARWPNNPPRRLEVLAQRLSPAAAALLNRFDRELYAGDQAQWDGAELWKKLAPMLRSAGDGPGSDDGDSPLPPLYPQGT